MSKWTGRTFRRNAERPQRPPANNAPESNETKRLSKLNVWTSLDRVAVLEKEAEAVLEVH